MEILLLFIGLVLPWTTLAQTYNPVGVPFLKAKITMSSVNRSVSLPGVPGVAFPRFPAPQSLLSAAPGFRVWHAEVGLPQWIKVELSEPIVAGEFAFEGRLSFDSDLQTKKRGKTHYRLEAVNPNPAAPGESPSCTIGWKTLKEEDDADHFSWEGDSRSIKVDAKEPYRCFRLFFPEVPMDDNCRHFVIVSDLRLAYAQPPPAACAPASAPCGCYTKDAAFAGPGRKFVSWQMRGESFQEQVLPYTFPQPEVVFAFEFKTDSSRPQDGPTSYSLTATEEDGREVELMRVEDGRPFLDPDETRRHRFLPPPGAGFLTYSLRVRRVGWMGPGAAGGWASGSKGWVQVRDVRFYLTRMHKYDAETGEIL